MAKNKEPKLISVECDALLEDMHIGSSGTILIFTDVSLGDNTKADSMLKLARDKTTVDVLIEAKETKDTQALSIQGKGVAKSFGANNKGQRLFIGKYKPDNDADFVPLCHTAGGKRHITVTVTSAQGELEFENEADNK